MRHIICKNFSISFSFLIRSDQYSYMCDFIFFIIYHIIANCHHLTSLKISIKFLERFTKFHKNFINILIFTFFHKISI